MDVEIVKKAVKLEMTAHGNLEKAITARIECRTEEDGDRATSCGIQPGIGFSDEARIFAEEETKGHRSGGARRKVCW